MNKGTDDICLQEKEIESVKRSIKEIGQLYGLVSLRDSFILSYKAS